MGLHCGAAPPHGPLSSFNCSTCITSTAPASQLKAAAQPLPNLQEYNKFQVKQLTKLIEVTRTELKKEDRQKVMNMITIDAHSRDMVESIVESGADRCDPNTCSSLPFTHCTTS